MPTSTSDTSLLTTDVTVPRANGESLLFRVAGMVAVSVTVLTLVLRAARPLHDPDLWWHLRLGEEWLGGWSINDPGQLTAFATSSWFARSWLPQVMMARTEQWFGLPGIAWGYGFLQLSVMVAVYLVARRRSDVMIAGLVTTVVMFGASLSMTARPHLLSYVLLVLATGSWVRTVDTLSPPTWLIPATWLWAASNGMWSTAVILGLGVVVGLAFDGRLNLRTGGRLLVVPLGSIVAAAATPVGPRLVLGASESWAWQQYITEFAAPDITRLPVMTTWLLVGVVVIIWVRRREQVSWGRIAVLAMAALWTLFAVRSVTWGALMMTPLAAEAVQSLIPRAPLSGFGRRELGWLGAIVGVALVSLALVVGQTSDRPAPAGYPLALGDELAALPEGTPILNVYHLGGWLEWSHRQLDPVIDGNTNGFRLEDIQQYETATTVRPGWEDYVRDKRVAHALLPVDSPLAHALVTQLDWEVVGETDEYELLTAPSGAQ